MQILFVISQMPQIPSGSSQRNRSSVCHLALPQFASIREIRVKIFHGFYVAGVGVS